MKGLGDTDSPRAILTIESKGHTTRRGHGLRRSGILDVLWPRNVYDVGVEAERNVW